MEKLKLDLIIEQGKDGIWGRVNFNNNLIADVASSVAELEVQIKHLLHEFEGVDPDTVEFQHLYDVYALFEQFDYLKIGKLAEHAGINPGLMRQYAAGVKHPSAKQAKKIEDTFHKLADEMNRALVYAE